jgi:hypothetical protein
MFHVKSVLLITSIKQLLLAKDAHSEETYLSKFAKNVFSSGQKVYATAVINA